MAFWNIFYYHQHFIIIMNFAIKSKIRQKIRFLKEDSLAFNFVFLSIYLKMNLM